MPRHSILIIVLAIFLALMVNQVSASEVDELANARQSQISSELDKTVLKLTISISNSGVRLLGGGSVLALIPVVTDYETGRYIQHLYPQPREGKIPLDRREDLEGRLMRLRCQINQNPALKEDTIFIIGDPDVSMFTFMAVMMLCHQRDVGFTNTVLLSELPEELYRRTK